MMLAEIVETSRRISEASRRTEKTKLLADLLRRLQPDEVGLVVAWLAGRTPQGRIGIGYRTLQEARGLPAEAPTLAVLDVHRRLSGVAEVQGRGSERQRLGLVHDLLSKATGAEQHFLVRLLTGELRQGALDGLMVEAIAKASGLQLEAVRRAVMMAGDSAVVAQSALAGGQAGLEQYTIELFRPVQPMLAQTAEDIEDAMEQMGEAALEYKIDGARVQVHRSGKDVVVFSRRLNDVTPAVPEVVEAVRALPGRDLILDGEVISLEPDGRPRPFQTTMRRFGRKLDVERMRGELPLTPFWFDLLYLNGAPLLDEPQSRRFPTLAGLAAPQSVIPHVRTGDATRAADFLREALNRGHEGVMAKAPGAPYAAGARGQNWLKVKQARTLDLVILAAEWGHGRRQGWLSNLHLGARDTENGGFAMLGKTFKGLTDEMLEWQTQQLLKLEIGRDEYTVYVAPKLVVEIAFNEIQVSPRYASGLALRFARVKTYRADKTAEETDTFQTVRRMAETAESQEIA